MRTSTKLLLLMANRLPTAYSTAWANTDGWTGAGLSVAGGNATITPTLGAELLTNPGFEAPYTAGVANGWTKFGTPTPSENTTDPRSGTSAQQITGSATTANALRQAIAMDVGKWYIGAMYERKVSGAGICTLGWFGQSGSGASAGTYTLAQAVIRATTTSHSLVIGGSDATLVGLYDDGSVKELNTSTLLAYRNMGYSIGSISAPMTRAQGTPIGLMLYKDASNFLLLYDDGLGRLKLTQCVAGTYTDIANVAMTYVPGATLKLSVPGDNVASGYYNGAKLIDSAVINAVFATATQWGIFSTYASNTIGTLSWSTTP